MNNAKQQKTYSEMEYNELIDNVFETLTEHYLAEGHDDQLSTQIEGMPDPKLTTIAMTYDTTNNTWVARDIIGDLRHGG